MAAAPVRGSVRKVAVVAAVSACGLVVAVVALLVVVLSTGAAAPPTGALATPTGLTVRGWNGQFEIRFIDNATDETGYEYFNGEYSKKVVGPLVGTGPREYWWSWVGHEPVRMCFKVRATNDSGVSDWTPEKCTTSQ